MVDESRSFRVDIELWERFGQACSENYTNRTEKINQFIHHYVHQHEMSVGHLSPEMRDKLAETIESVTKKQSVKILQDILERMFDQGASTEEVLNATDPDSIKDLL